MPIPKPSKKTPAEKTEDPSKASAKPNVPPSTPTKDGKIVDKAPGAPATNVDGQDGTKPILSEVPEDEKTQPPAPLEMNEKSASADDVAELRKRVQDLEAQNVEYEQTIERLRGGSKVGASERSETKQEKSARIAKANKDASYAGSI